MVSLRGYWILEDLLSHLGAQKIRSGGLLFQWERFGSLDLIPEFNSYLRLVRFFPGKEGFQLPEEILSLAPVFRFSSSFL